MEKIKKLVLLYNFSEERVRLTRKALAPLGCIVRSVGKKDFSQKVGALTGLKGYRLEKIRGSEETFSEELLVMYGFSGVGIDILINALKAGGVGYVPLKAVVTETNAAWNGIKLYREVKSDHEAMKKTPLSH